MKFGRAIVSGVIGGVLVIAIVFAAGLGSGQNADLCALLGNSVTGTTGALSWTLGLAAQLAVAIAAALLYAIIFERVTRRAGVLVGLAIAPAHTIIAGLAVGFLPAAQLLSRGGSPPGAFLEYRGFIVAGAFVMAHLLFGVIVGGAYGAPRHSIPRTAAVWHDVTSTR
ncbi:MAG: hypothetical protein ACJ796_17040 [Gemmatimonadaceae bacterium]